MKNVADISVWNIPEDFRREFRIESDKKIQSLLKKTLTFFHKSIGPVFVGNVSIESCISLNQAQMLVDVLVDSDQVRKATHDEIVAIGADPSCDPAIYVLTEKAKIWLAYDR